MSNEKSKYSKDDFIRFVLSTAHSDSDDALKARELLASEGVDVDAVVSSGLKRIRKIRLQIQAEQTKNEMLSADLLKQKATQWVEDLMSKIDFSFMELAKQESLTVNFSSLENLTTEDIKNILIKHYTLKFLEDQNKKS